MKKPVTITLHLSDYLDKAFKTLPANAIIHKGRCGIGGTTLEIKARRCSIIVVPTKGIIKDKHRSHHEIFGVDGDVELPDIMAYLGSNARYKKVMVTPDSFGKIIQAAISIGKFKELQQEYFLLMDECHTAITEAFRERILSPFRYIWGFKSKSFISATPIAFSDEHFKSLTHYYIRFHEKYIGTIVLMQSGDISACVDWYIQNRHLFPGKLFFFYNSVLEIADTIRRNKLTADITHIYCADKEDNFNKLSEQLLAFQQQPLTGKYAEVNFFTTKYFEGFDLYEPNATIILVTDVHKTHTKVGITNKGVQAVGRIRDTPHQLIHITNNRNQEGMKTISQFKKEYEIHTRKLIGDYNSYIAECKEEGIEPLQDTDKLIRRFVEIDKETKQATLELNKLDQVLNELVCNEQFNNNATILQAWEQSLFKVKQRPFISKPVSKRYKSKADKMKEQIELVDQLVTNKDSYVMGFAANELSKLQQDNPIAVEAYHLLGRTILEELEYNEKLIKQRLIELHNKNAEPKLLAYLDRHISVGSSYSIADMQSTLQYGYSLFQIRNPKTGQVKVATAKEYENSGYKLRDCKLSHNGKPINGFTIKCKNFSLQTAA